MIFVPAKFASEAIMAAIDAEIGLIVCITEGNTCARYDCGES